MALRLRGCKRSLLVVSQRHCERVPRVWQSPWQRRRKVLVVSAVLPSAGKPATFPLRFYLQKTIFVHKTAPFINKNSTICHIFGRFEDNHTYFSYLCTILRGCPIITENNNTQHIMKALRNLMDETGSQSMYEAPRMEVVEISVERGFEVSSDGFGLGDDTSYDEEDVDW